MEKIPLNKEKNDIALTISYISIFKTHHSINKWSGDKIQVVLKPPMPPLMNRPKFKKVLTLIIIFKKFLLKIFLSMQERQIHKGPFINYVTLGGGGGLLKTDGIQWWGGFAAIFTSRNL